MNVENELLVPNESNEQTAIAMPSTSTSDIWKSFDERVSSLVGQNNSTVASVVEMDKYLN